MSAYDPSAQGLPLAGGGGGGLPAAAGADEIPVSTGPGTTYVAVTAFQVVADVLDAALGAEPAGTTIKSDGAGAVTTTSATVSTFLDATTLPFTGVVNAVEHTTNNGTGHHLLTISCATNSRAYTFRGTISAARDDYSNAYAWDVIAALSHATGGGGLQLRTALITPTDPASPYTVAVNVNGNNLRVEVTGVLGHNVQWHGGGFLTVYGA